MNVSALRHGPPAAAAALIAGTLLLTTATPAFASTCSRSYQNSGLPGYYYDGQANFAHSHGGIEGQLTRGNILLNRGLHDINYLGLARTTNDKCARNTPLSGTCSIQAGDGIGDVGGYYSNGLQGYMEENDYNGYSVDWFNANCVTPLAYISVYNTGRTAVVSGQTLYYFEAVASTTQCGHLVVGGAYINLPQMQAFQSAEVDMATNGACPSFNSLTFGGNNDGSFNSGTVLQASQNGLTGWHSVYAQTSTVDAPYNIDYYSGAGQSAFGAYGQ